MMVSKRMSLQSMSASSYKRYARSCANRTAKHHATLSGQGVYWDVTDSTGSRLHVRSSREIRSIQA